MAVEEYGLDPIAERNRYARYVERFGIRPERKAGPVRPVESSVALAGRSAEATKKVSSANPRGDTVAPDALLAARLESTRRVRSALPSDGARDRGE